jgi:hypothetical protein
MSVRAEAIQPGAWGGFNMKFLMMVMMSLFIGHSAFAATNLTISCDVEVQGERTDDTTTSSVTFDADQGYKDLTLNVYDSPVKVSANLYMSANGKTCGHELSICVPMSSAPDSSSSSDFCTDKSDATIFPTDATAQSGDRTYIKCSLAGGQAAACPR